MATEPRAGTRALPSPNGLRKLSPNMISTLKAANDFQGLPDTMPGQILAAFKSAAPALGISRGIVYAVDWLFKWTKPQDWRPGSRPMVWPTAEMQQAAWGVSYSQVKRLNRQMAELGLIVMRDSPYGRRHGRRGGDDNSIIMGFGFDLSPLGLRYEEFKRAAADAERDRRSLMAARQRAASACNAIRQALCLQQEQGVNTAANEARLEEALQIRERIKRATDPEGAAQMAFKLETAAEQAFAMLCTQPTAPEKPVKMDPNQGKNAPLYTTTNQLQSVSSVMAQEQEGPSRHPNIPGNLACAAKAKAPTPGESGQRQGRGAGDRLSVASTKIAEQEVLQIAPRLTTYLATSNPDWNQIVDAGDWLRGEMGISKQAWGEACLILGRERAALAVGLVSRKKPTDFTKSPAAYFAGMVGRARAGELHLDRSIWAIRQAMGEGRLRARGAAAGGLTRQ